MSADEKTYSERMLEAAQADSSGFKIPPPIFLDMEAEIVSSDAQSLTIRFPVKERYQNPTGNMQGGMIVTAIDNVMGPLAYMVAPPSATSSMTTNFIRPVTPENEYIIVTARVEEQTKRFLYLSADVYNEAGDVLTKCTATMVVIGRKKVM